MPIWTLNETRLQTTESSIRQYEVIWIDALVIIQVDFTVRGTNDFVNRQGGIMRNGCDVIEHLTAREEEVLNLIARGRSAKEAALELRIAPCTVERHIENIRLKTRTRNRAHMIAVVIRDGWFSNGIVDRPSRDLVSSR